MLKQFRSFFWTTVIGGLVVILPLTLLIVVFNILYNFVRKAISPISSVLTIKGINNAYIIEGIVIAILVILCFLLGLFIRTQVGKNLFLFIEVNLLSRIPFYDTLKEIVQQFSGQRQTPFSQVVLVRAFGGDTLMTGFITDNSNPGIWTVFVPTGPNPTNGFIMHVKPDQITFVDTKAEDAMRTIIGVGAGSSIILDQIFKNPEKKI